jgi:hypothetical protein
VTGAALDYFFYYAGEEGLGGHKHDVESAQFRIVIFENPARSCTECPYIIGVARVLGKAHGLEWYDNTLKLDIEAKMPLSLLVEEGKHATCPDKNADGVYTPSYDVNLHPNDAWGVRDVMRGGGLFTGGFEAWMAKPRTDAYRVLPPLPADSPLRQGRSYTAALEAGNAVYELRPWPTAEQAEPDLVHFIADKGAPNWPETIPDSDFNSLMSWAREESFVKSLSIMYRMDGDGGFSFVFPLFIVRAFNEPLAGGWISNRIYFKDENLRDFSWGLLYSPPRRGGSTPTSPPASRWTKSPARKRPRTSSAKPGSSSGSTCCTRRSSS